MPNPSRVVLALLLVMGAASVRPQSDLMASPGESSPAGRSAQGATLKAAASASPNIASAEVATVNIPSPDYDPQAEDMLLILANQARTKAGLGLLTPDAGLSRAARTHAERMVAAQQLSHQLDGELPLPQRLADITDALLDQEGENVAVDFDAARGHEHLMQSAPHRANLLKASYNVIGLGVVRSGGRIYIVQDFGRALPNFSVAEVKERIVATISQARHRVKLSDLTSRDLPSMDPAACSMAQADKLGSLPIQQIAQRYTVLSYTSLHPESLPLTAERALAERNLRGFAVGACYARTQTYPTGAYWVVLALE